MGKLALLVLVHGSPRPSANESVFRVVEDVRRRAVFPIVEVGFLECNTPSIPEAIARCVAQGATEVVGVPYFLHTGTHVADDIPSLFEQAQQRYPTVRFRIGPYLGSSPQLTQVLAKRIRDAITNAC